MASFATSTENPERLYQIIDKIGEGSYGEVYRAVQRSTGLMVAIKIIPIDESVPSLAASSSSSPANTSKGSHTGTSGGTPLNDLKREVELLKQVTTTSTKNTSSSSSSSDASPFLSSTNLIVNYMDSYFYRQQLWLVTEYMDGGSLADLLQAIQLYNEQNKDSREDSVPSFPPSSSSPLTFTEECIADALCFVVHGLVFLHSHRIVHRDLKAGNILLSSDGKAKLADFGVAVQLSNTLSKRRTLIGSPYWMAPEVVLESSYAYPADIWSLGITALELAEGSPPLASIHPMRAIFLIASRDAPFFTHPEQWSTDFQNFVHQCLQKNPNDRMRAIDLLRHPFLHSAHERILRDHGLSLALMDILDRLVPFMDEQRQELQLQDNVRKEAKEWIDKEKKEGEEETEKGTKKEEETVTKNKGPSFDAFTGVVGTVTDVPPIDTKGESSAGTSTTATSSSAPYSSGTMIYYHHSRTSDPNNLTPPTTATTVDTVDTNDHHHHYQSMGSTVLNDHESTDDMIVHTEEDTTKSSPIPAFIQAIRFDEETKRKFSPSSVPGGGGTSSTLTLPVPSTHGTVALTTTPPVSSATDLSNRSIPTVPSVPNRPDIYSTLSDPSFLTRITSINQLNIQLQALNIQYQKDTLNLNQKYQQACNGIQQRIDHLKNDSINP